MAIAPVRPLTTEERELVQWLVTHGHSSARACADQIAKLEVIGEERGGDRLVLEFARSNASTPRVMLAEFFERSDDGQVTTVVLFGQNGRLAAIEAWAAEGGRAPQLPKPGGLHAVT